MARNKTKSSPVLPGLSRSTECRFGSCHRLAGHHGAHRGTLQAATSSPVVKAAVKAPKVTSPAIVLDKTLTVGGETWHIVVLADGTTSSTKVVESPAPTIAKAPAKARRTKVKVLPTATAEGRDVQTIRGKTSRRRNFVASGKPSARLADRPKVVAASKDGKVIAVVG